MINRHNNKYSYTSSSDDNLLKNIELFERMSIKFKHRIFFVKDTTSTEEICCWYFHGGGKKLAEVCCTSIVYTTEKKQTKVEFPDSRILEEIFVNAVLFESKETALTDGLTAAQCLSCEDTETDEAPHRHSIANIGLGNVLGASAASNSSPASIATTPTGVAAASTASGASAQQSSGLQALTSAINGIALNANNSNSRKSVR